MKKKYLTFGLCVSIVLIIDMLTKIVFEGKEFHLIKGFIGILSCHNSGAAFSMFSGYTIALIIFTAILMIIFMIYYIKVNNDNIVYQISFSLIMGGAIGNFIDRIIFGYVRDFINLEFINFAIFNIADTALTLGIIGLCVYILFLDKNNKFNDKNNTLNKNEDDNLIQKEK